MQNKNYSLISQTNEQTVVSEYTPDPNRSTEYQSESALEKELIDDLIKQGYDRLNITDEAGLIANLRTQLEELNNYKFTDSEWERFFSNAIANKNDGIVEKTTTIQEDYIKNLTRDDGTTKNIYLINKTNIHANHLQVINQYATDSGTHSNRYDVTILVNGLPLVHIELKRRGVAIKEAFNQIKRYNRESFWADYGLFQYTQLYIISNGTSTKYYSNTTREQHFNQNAKSGKKTSNSFEFTSYWADSKNKRITDLKDFTKTFLSKHTILNILTKYCVFTSDRLLLVMRPYQIAATERILNRIEITNNNKKYGSVDGGGYIWHTTGSGKTLTSFKTAQIASKLDYIDKVLFVVDRKDLDYQTMKEYDKFQKGAADGNTSTKILQDQLEDDNSKIIVTTIQKLGIFVGRNKTHDIYNKHIVLIFDECHRSQFGDMHKAITKAFKKYHIFGFTGTPIFAANSGSGGDYNFKTTVQAFGCKIHGGDMGNCSKAEKHQAALHTYTIADAINDENVLPFRIDYINTVKEKESIQDKKVSSIEYEKALLDDQRIKDVVDYILEHFEQKTKRGDKSYTHTITANVEEMAGAKDRRKIEELREKRRLIGFNSIFTVSSIVAAKKYYNELKSRDSGLKVATIFSYSPNEEDPDEDFNTDGLDKASRDFLEGAISDYNTMFNTSYDTSSDKFQNYYKDLSQRTKNREIDILLVVDMFLTGFDATTLNTLWVDKRLKQHGLIQAFSRTNRILNSIKTFGNIICFRDLKQQTDDAISLFGDTAAGGIVTLKPFGEYMEEYQREVDKLKQEYPLDKSILGEEDEKEFIKLMGSILRLRNILTSFDEFVDLITERDLQDYTSNYIDLYQKYRKLVEGDSEPINDDLIFEMELVKQIEVNIDYILMLVTKYHASNCQDKEILATIDKAIDSSVELRNKKELIEKFIESVNLLTDIDDDWEKFVKQQKEVDLKAIIEAEQLKEKETRNFVDNALRDGQLKTTGTDIDKILPPVSRFSKDGERSNKKKSVITKLMAFFEKFVGLVR